VGVVGGGPPHPQPQNPNPNPNPSSKLFLINKFIIFYLIKNKL
jgi:hypothetical protein